MADKDFEGRDDFEGWGPRAWDQLLQRIQSLEKAVERVDNAIARLIGAPLDESTGNPKIRGIGLTTWIALTATVTVPIMGVIIAIASLK